MNRTHPVYSGSGGAKGGSGSSRTPEEAPDTLKATSYVEVIDLLSEGPIFSFVDKTGAQLIDCQISRQPSIVGGAIQNDCLFRLRTGYGYPTFDDIGAHIPVVIEGDGSGAQAHATVGDDGRVTGVVVSNGGVNYTQCKLTVRPCIGKAIYLDDIPIQNDNLSYNYDRVFLEFRNGTVDQLPFPNVHTQSPVETTPFGIRSDVAYVKAFSGNYDQLVVGISVDALMSTDVSDGDTSGGSVTYRAYIQRVFDGITLDPDTTAENARVLFEDTITGKASSKYVRAKTVVLPKGVTAEVYSWNIRIVRVTPDSSSIYVRDSINVEYITGVTHTPYRYPYSAMVYIKIDAEQFSKIPTRSYLTKGLQIQLPKNYFCETEAAAVLPDGEPYPNAENQLVKTWNRTYNRNELGEAVVDGNGNPVEQPWDGTFYIAWTNNPAWIFYDLATNRRYGLGEYIVHSTGGVDKWELYSIARYCDEMIANGQNQFAPRFTCNTYYQTRENAYEVLNQLASVFRGFTYWANGNVVAVCDRPTDAYKTFTNANVEGGLFNYTTASRKTRHTACYVRWIDPLDQFRPKYEYAENTEGIMRYGFKPLELSAVGCTSKAEARRTADAALFADLYEGKTVSFIAGMEGAGLRPGDVYKVLDSNHSGVQYGGRLLEISNGGLHAHLDRYIDFPDSEETSSFNFIVVDPQADRQANEITTSEELVSKRPAQIKGFNVKSFILSNGKTVVELYEPLPSGVVKGSVWGIESTKINAQEFRCLSVDELNPMRYEVIGVKYYRAKYEHIDRATPFEVPSTALDPHEKFLPRPVTDLHLEQQSVLDGGREVYRLSASWRAPVFVDNYGFGDIIQHGLVLSYEIWIKRENGNFSLAGMTRATEIEIDVLTVGTYTFRVYTLGLHNRRSSYVEAAITVSAKYTAENEFISGLEISYRRNSGQANVDTFEHDSVGFEWRKNSPHNSYEFGEVPGDYGGMSPNFSNYIMRILNPNDPLGMPVWEGTTTQQSIHFPFTELLAMEDGPHRDFIFEIQFKDNNANLSLPSSLRVTNERPAALDHTLVTKTATSTRAAPALLNLIFPARSVSDFKEWRVWIRDATLGSITLTELVPDDSYYDVNGEFTVAAVEDARYQWIKGLNDTSLEDGVHTIAANGERFWSLTTSFILKGRPGQPVTARVYQAPEVVSSGQSAVLDVVKGKVYNIIVAEADSFAVLGNDVNPSSEFQVTIPYEIALNALIEL